MRPRVRFSYFVKSVLDQVVRRRIIREKVQLSFYRNWYIEFVRDKVSMSASVLPIITLPITITLI